VTEGGTTSAEAVAVTVGSPPTAHLDAALGGATRARIRLRPLVRRVLVGADIAGFSLAYLAAAWEDHHLAGRVSSGVFLLSLPVWLAAAQAFGLYDRDARRPDHSTLDELGRLVQLVTVGTWCGLIGIWALSGHIPMAAGVVFWALSVALVAVARTIVRAGLRRRDDYVQKTIILGAGEVGQLVARKLVQHPEYGVRVLGFVDANPRPMRGELASVRVLGPPGDLVDLARSSGAERIIVAFSRDHDDKLVHLVRSVRQLGVQIDVVPRLFDTVGPLGELHFVEGLPLVSLYRAEESRLARSLKRAVDILGASIVLLVSLPFFAWVAFRIKRDSPGPVFFRQVRLGQGQRTFTLFKFRTMTIDADDGPHREYIRQIMDAGASPAENGLYKLERHEDVTRVGRWLRRTSLDELPQLINVIRGEMSLVGPRPCIPYETELFEPHHFDRFLVPAGMTGLWQVSARARATLKEALDLDAAYARNWTLGLDLWLLARTPLTLFRGGATT